MLAGFEPLQDLLEQLVSSGDFVGISKQEGCLWSLKVRFPIGDLGPSGFLSLC